MIIGERSNGKTYSVKEHCLNKFISNNGKFMYLRRRKEHKTRKYMQKLFSDINDNYLDKLGLIKYTNDFGFYVTDDLDDSPENRTTIGYCTSIEECYDMKGIPFNEITTIFFDEFLEYGSPIEDEIAKFLHIISTIVRKRDNVEVFMVANTVTKFSPYFDLFGIDIKKIKQGEIYYFKHANGVSGAIEYCASKNIIDGKKISNKYIGFDNNATADMILYGQWEYDIANTKRIDDITWNSNRKLLPIYITALGLVYEISLYEKGHPVAFIRKVNTQQGFVKKYIKYNLSYDNSVILRSEKGIVPIYKKINGLVKMIDNDVYNLYNIFKLCLDCGRVIFDTIETGSDFTRVISKIL